MEPKRATQSDWDEDEERQRIGVGQYNGFIIQNVKVLLEKLPHPRPEFDDAYQEFVGYALEAVGLFVPARGVQFGTFLYRHLNIRSLQWFNCAWMVKHHPKGRFITSFSQFADRTDSDLNERILFDPTRVRATQTIESMVNELRESLSPRTRQLFDYFVDLVSWADNKGSSEVLDCFRSPYFQSRVAALTGLEKSEVKEVIREITLKARRYVPV